MNTDKNFSERPPEKLESSRFCEISYPFLSVFICVPAAAGGSKLCAIYGIATRQLAGNVKG